MQQYLSKKRRERRSKASTTRHLVLEGCSSCCTVVTPAHDCTLAASLLNHPAVMDHKFTSADFLAMVLEQRSRGNMLGSTCCCDSQISVLLCFCPSALILTAELSKTSSTELNCLSLHLSVSPLLSLHSSLPRLTVYNSVLSSTIRLFSEINVSVSCRSVALTAKTLLQDFHSFNVKIL